MANDDLKRLSDDRLIDEKELAAICAVTRETVRYWRRTGNGPRYLHLGTNGCPRVRYWASDVAEFLNRFKVEPGRRAAAPG